MWILCERMKHLVITPFHGLQLSYEIPYCFSVCWIRLTVNKSGKRSIKAVKHIIFLFKKQKAFQMLGFFI